MSSSYTRPVTYHTAPIRLALPLNRLHLAPLAHLRAEWKIETEARKFLIN